MIFRSGFLAFLMVLAGAMIGPPARASTLVYTLTGTTCASGCGNGPYGTVTISQDSLNARAIDITVALDSGYAFHRANDVSHHALAFNLAGDPLVTFGGYSSNVFLRDPLTFNDAMYGSFSYTLDCVGNRTGTCASGYTAANPTTLSFVITPNTGSLTPESIVGNNASTPVFFTVEVTNNGTCALCVASTSGVVAASAPAATTAVANVAAPEPMSAGLFGIGCAGVVLARGRKRGRPRPV